MHEKRYSKANNMRCKFNRLYTLILKDDMSNCFAHLWHTLWLNQKMNPKKPKNTCWNSHYSAHVSLIHMFSFIIDVNAMKIVEFSKQQLQAGRSDGKTLY